ncbi:MAG: SH3 domain-containing protein [Bacteroidota bacterium]
MKINLVILFSTLLLCSLSCGPAAPEEVKEELTETAPVVEQEAPTRLIVNIDKFRLRDQPGLKGKALKELSEGELLYDLDEVSDFTTPIKLRGIAFDEPWIKVKTADDLEGWVYAGGVHFDLDSPSKLAQKLIDLRLQAIFGASLSREMKAYSEAYQKAADSESLAIAYRKGMTLRDSLVELMEFKIPVPDMDPMPDLSWLEGAMPGFETARVAEGTMHYLFADYKVWSARSTTTEGAQDDRFFSLCMDIHNLDSVEYFYPAWFIQTWDYGGHSLLGKGIHLKTFKGMDNLLQESLFFQSETQKIKNQLIEDITGEYMTYWESQKAILEELDAILAADLDVVLTDEDRVALQTRRKMFEQYKANKIKLNHRSGEVQ